VHLHFLVTEGGVDEAGVFHKIPRIDDSRFAEIFAREVLAMLVHKELLSPEWAERLLSWPHSGFNVHSLVRAKTKIEAERVGKYMLRPVLALERLTFLEPEGKVGYSWGRDGPGQETEVMDYLEFIARVTSHIPDKGQVMVRYYGLYANAQFSSATSSSPLLQRGPRHLAGALDGRGSPGRIFLRKLSYAEGEVRVISGSAGSADGFQVVCPRSPGVIDMFPALIYASVRRRDGIIDAKTRLQPAQQKTKYLWRKILYHGFESRVNRH
jgi:hypothetical protein